jgi:hypothetical protein
MTYPVSHATRGSEKMIHINMRFDGVCAHFALRPRVGVCFEGLASTSEKSSGCPRVPTMIPDVRIFTVREGLIRVRIGCGYVVLTGVAALSAIPYSTRVL